MSWTPDRAASIAVALRAAESLMALAPADHMSYFIRGVVGSFTGAFLDTAIADLRRAHELNPNDAMVLFVLAWSEAAAGDVERARTYAGQAMRLSPKDRWIGVAHLAYAMSAFIDRDWPGLREWAELAIQSHPTAPIRRVLMVAYAAEVDDPVLLRTHLDRVRTVSPDFVPSLFRGDYRPFQRPEHMAMLLDSLRRAGVTATPRTGEGT